MTRILVLSNMYPPHHLGGYELSCRDVMDRLRARGHDVTVLTTNMRLKGVEEPPDERSGGVLRDLRFYWDDHVLLKPSLPRRIAIERGNQRALAAAIERARPEVVSAWNMGAMSLGLLTTVVERGIPLVLNVCDEWPIYGPKIDPWTRLFVDRPRAARLARRLTGVATALADLGEHATFLFVSDLMRRRTEERSRWRPQTATVVYSGIDRGDFPREPPGARAWRWRLLHVGRLDDRKGVHVAVEAMKHMPPDARLDILGRGDPVYLRRLEELVEALQLRERVRFGIVPRAELPRHYTAADAVVFPTLWDEPFGLVPVEAMACGTPVVATGTGGSAEFLADGANCIIVPPGDPAALATAVGRLVGEPQLRRRLIEGGLKTAEELDTDRLTDVLELWHVGAAERFARGLPPDRPSPLRVLSARGESAAMNDS